MDNNKQDQNQNPLPPAQVIAPDQIYPQAPTDQLSQSQTGAVLPEANKVSRKRQWLVHLSFVCALAILVGGVYFGLQYMKSHDGVITEQEQAASEKSYEDRGKEFIKDHKTEFFKPGNTELLSPSLSNVVTTTDKLLATEKFTFFIAKSTGGNWEPGEIRVMQLSASDAYDPPNDCGPFEINGILNYYEKWPCKKIVEKSAFTGYIYDWPSETADEKLDRRILYAKLNSTIVAIAGTDISIDRLVDYLDGMVPMTSDDFPKDTNTLVCGTDQDNLREFRCI